MRGRSTHARPVHPKIIQQRDRGLFVLLIRVLRHEAQHGLLDDLGPPVIGCRKLMSRESQDASEGRVSRPQRPICTDSDELRSYPAPTSFQASAHLPVARRGSRPSEFRPPVRPATVPARAISSHPDPAAACGARRAGTPAAGALSAGPALRAPPPAPGGPAAAHASRVAQGCGRGALGGVGAVEPEPRPRARRASCHRAAAALRVNVPCARRRRHEAGAAVAPGRPRGLAEPGPRPARGRRLPCPAAASCRQSGGVSASLFPKPRACGEPAPDHPCLRVSFSRRRGDLPREGGLGVPAGSGRGQRGVPAARATWLRLQGVPQTVATFRNGVSLLRGGRCFLSFPVAGRGWAGAVCGAGGPGRSEVTGAR